MPDATFPDKDSIAWANAGVEVRSINWSQLNGDGILHTKMMVVDGIHAYVGSANLVGKYDVFRRNSLIY